jgi:hypothetical protein
MVAGLSIQHNKNRVLSCLRLSTQLPDYPEQHAQHKADQDHGSDRKVKAKVFPDDFNITRKVPKPLEIATSEPDKPPDDNQKEPYADH